MLVSQTKGEAEGAAERESSRLSLRVISLTLMILGCAFVSNPDLA